MKDPRDALAAARAAAARRDAGEADSAELDDASWVLDDPTVSARRLAEWAIVAPEQAEVYSTRRFGQPITAVKRLLIRMLEQYLGQISAQQSRFNAQVAAHVVRLEERVVALEQAARKAERGDQPPR